MTKHRHCPNCREKLLKDEDGEFCARCQPSAVEMSLRDNDGEVVVKLADGHTLRSGSTNDAFISGEWVRLCDPKGKELLYWHNDEWKEDPILVVGAIINAAAGLRVEAR